MWVLHVSPKSQEDNTLVDAERCQQAMLQDKTVISAVMKN